MNYIEEVLWLGEIVFLVLPFCIKRKQGSVSFFSRNVIVVSLAL